MRKSEIEIGGVYLARVSVKVVQVRVDDIREGTGFKGQGTSYDVTNLSTGRRTTFRSAARFRSPAKEAPTQLERSGESGSTPSLCPRCGSENLHQDQWGDWHCSDCGFDIGDPEEEDEKGSDPTSVQISTQTSLPAVAAVQPVEQPAQPVTPRLKVTANRSLFRPSAPATPALPQPAPEKVGEGSGLASHLRRQKSTSPSKAPPHLIVEARAGSGKTTTLVEGLKLIKGGTPSIEPSKQQQMVWEQMALSKGVKTVCFVAFNKSIAEELKRRVPPGCDAMTMHSMGFSAVRRAYGQVQVESYRVADIIAELLERDIRDLRRERPVVISATEQLVGLCKMNLAEPKDGRTWEEVLDYLVGHYDVDTNDSRHEVYELVPKVLERCKDVKHDNRIDFNDMIWLPVVLNLPIFRYDLLLVDEAQDLNRCQQSLARRAGNRLILCGDPRQAIYGFAGADADSMPRMQKELGESCLGCVTLPLTVTRRCGKKIVEEAKKIVEDFDAHDDNPDGIISEGKYPVRKRPGETPIELKYEETYMFRVEDGDFILCRVNAPLVSQCFRFLKRGRKAQIQGRDIGQGLISTIKKLKAKDVADLVGKIDDWLHGEMKKEQAKRNPSENRIIAMQDRADCLVCFCEGAQTVEEVIGKIEEVFTDDKNVIGIRLSSVHKAKGLESKRVFLLQPEGCGMPHPMAKSAWQRQQEWNLLYVAITRAIEELVYVS